MYVRSKEHTSRDSSAAGRLRRGATLGLPGEPRAQHTARYPIFFSARSRHALQCSPQSKTNHSQTPHLRLHEPR